MDGFVVKADFLPRLLQQLQENYQVVGPVRGKDDVCRLQPLDEWSEHQEFSLPRISVKKYLFPPNELLYTTKNGTFEPPPPPEQMAVVGVPSCDLYAVDFLDRVFADDPLYQRRRSNLLLVGITCHPSEDCFCPPRDTPPPFDLFLDEERVFSGTPRGDELLQQLGDRLIGEVEIDHDWTCEAQGPPLPENLERRWAANETKSFWEEIGGRCLGCGACSAVCPTCHCFDMQDRIDAAGNAVRHRIWDNCFFPNFALVAGGHDFHPTRGARFRFRCEHKLLGFGVFRGESSCVGCGRCRAACPVQIDILEALDHLREGAIP